MNYRPHRRYHKRFEPVGDMQERTHPYYSIWSNMLSRCYWTKDANYINYGARGIAVCSRWLHFKNFVEDMGDKPDKSFTLERINNDLGYSKDNCKWASRSDQCINRRRFKNNTTGHTGVVKVKDRYEARIDYKGVRYRVGRYATVEEAVSARLAAKHKVSLGQPPDVSDESIWCTSTTKLRGISQHKDGGYIVRATINGERKYLGYFKTLDEAKNAKHNRD